MSTSQVARAVKAALTSVAESLWTWSGICFGYRRGDSLFTYDGVEVGRFVGADIFGVDGSYLGEIRSAGDGWRLLTSSYKKSRRADAFVPIVERPHSRSAPRVAERLYCGYEDFPPPDTLKAAVLEMRKQLKSFAGASPVQ